MLANTDFKYLSGCFYANEPSTAGSLGSSMLASPMHRFMHMVPRLLLHRITFSSSERLKCHFFGFIFCHTIYYPVTPETLAITSEFFPICNSGFNLLIFGPKINPKGFKGWSQVQPPAEQLPQVLQDETKAPPAVQLLSEQVWQDEAWGFGLHTVDPEVGTAGVVLVPSVCQLEVICL